VLIQGDRGSICQFNTAILFDDILPNISGALINLGLIFMFSVPAYPS